MSRYFYPDVEDRLVEKMVRVYGGRWEREELEVLNIVAKYLGDVGASRCIAVDVACGKGRLIPWIKSLICRSGEIIAFDLDISRLTKALDEIDVNTDLLLANAEFIPLRSSVADFVLCSHLIQHVTRSACFKILGEMHRIMKLGSYALIMTTHSDQDDEYYMVVREGGAEVVDAETFDAYASNPQRYALPVRKFDLRKLLDNLRDLGFDIVKLLFYHTKPTYLHVFKDVNELNKLGYEGRKYAIDVAILVRKVRHAALYSK